MTLIVEGLAFQSDLQRLLGLRAGHADPHRAPSGRGQFPIIAWRRGGGSEEEGSNGNVQLHFAISRISFHSSSRTGATDRRDWRISSLFASRGPAFILGRVPGFF